MPSGGMKLVQGIVNMGSCFEPACMVDLGQALVDNNYGVMKPHIPLGLSEKMVKWCCLESSPAGLVDKCLRLKECCVSKSVVAGSGSRRFVDEGSSESTALCQC